MIRNIIFDVGKVLVSYEPDAYMESLGISKENQKKINAAMFENKLWDASDQGLGTPDEFLQKFIGAIGNEQGDFVKECMMTDKEQVPEIFVKYCVL